MDLYNKFKIMFELQDMIKYRLLQLDDEKKIDNVLKNCNCQSEVVKYLLNMRELNHYHTNRINNSSVIEYAEKTKESYNDIQNIHNMLLNTNKEPRNCYEYCEYFLPLINRQHQIKFATLKK
jgi:hypothetical protein